MNTKRRNTLWLATVLAAGAHNALAANSGPAVWLQEFYSGGTKLGETRFYDWGYVGPGGRHANEFSSIGGFNGASQIQHVVTLTPDRLTPDAPKDVYEDLAPSYDSNGDPIPPLYPDANMDGQVNFYRWGYTTRAGSTFSNMQIDSDGDYFIAREDMRFRKYIDFSYQNEGSTSTADGTYATNISFKPYALSDAVGWCGSVMASNPSAAEAMAGQVTFDFGFKVTLPWGSGGMQIVPDFVMRSYGTMVVDFAETVPGTNDRTFVADAVVNNTNPNDTPVTGPGLIEVPVLNMDGTPALDEFGNPRTEWVPQKEVGGGAGADPDWYNKVSFMGGGVVPAGVWIRLVDPNGYVNDANIAEVYSSTDPDANPDPGNPAVIYHQNSFANYPFLMRADGIRVVEALDYSLYGDLSNVPGAIDTDGDGIPDTITNPDYDWKTDTYSTLVVADLSAVPVPGAVWLFGSGLLGLLGLARRKSAGA